MLYRFDNKKPQVGQETYISESALVIGDVKIGNNCYVGHGVILRGDYGSIEIGDGCAIEEGVVVHAPPGETCHIGNRVTLGHGAIVHSRSISDFSMIGMGAIVSRRAEVGSYSIVAEGGIVKSGQEIPSGVVVAGNPATTVREVTAEEKRRRSQGRLYIDLAKKYLAIGLHRID